MINSANLAEFVPFVSIPLSVLVGFRLIHSGLYRKYPCFTAFLGFVVIRLAILKLLPLSRYNYAVAWMGTEALSWIFYALILMELYTIVLSRYPGIQSLGRWVFHGSVIAALAIAALTIYPKLGVGENDFLMLFMIAERGILSALALLILLMTAFLTWFPVPLPRNVVLHSFLFACYFFSKATALLIRNIFGHEAAKGGTNLLIFAVGWICLLLWALLLTPAGEVVASRARRRWNEVEEGQLLDQLRDINSSLSRSTQ